MTNEERNLVLDDLKTKYFRKQNIAAELTLATQQLIASQARIANLEVELDNTNSVINSISNLDQDLNTAFTTWRNEQ